MKIAFLCAKDMAGVMYNLCEAVNTYTKHEAVHIISSLHPKYRFPYQHKITSANRAEMHALIYGCDAVVFSEWMGIIDTMKLSRRTLRRKMIAVTYGGGGFRLRRARIASVNYYGNINKNVKFIACSADFLERENLPWVPRCVRTSWLRETYDYGKLDPPLITASPSKSSDELNRKMGAISINFNRMMARLKARKLGFQHRLISSSKSSMSNDDCLRAKAPSSIFFDRLYSIYGVNSLEAGAFESAVVTGSSPKALDVIKRKMGVVCPFIIVHSWGQAEKAFTELLVNHKYMRRKGRECHEYVEAVGKYAANRLVKILER